MKSNKNRIIMSLLVLGMLFSLVTANTLNANENEDIEETETMEKEEETKEIVESVDEEPTVEEISEEVIADIVEDSGVATMSGIVTYAGTDPAFSSSSQSLHDAILANYPSIDTTPDGVISIDEANAKTGSIYLNGQSITGTLDGIEHFINVSDLRLHQNQLTGSIPEGLGDSNALTYLYLNDNQLIGEIPSTLGDIASLKYLYLNQNQLTGKIPETLGGISGLSRCMLSDNQLNGTIPASLGNLNSLVYLYLHENQLTGEIPSSLGSLQSLQYLSLYSNNLTGEIPSSLGNLNSLVSLLLSNNQLTGEIPLSLGNIYTLKTLHIYWNNELTGNLSAIFDNHPSLEVVIVNRTSTIQKKPQITTLKVYICDLMNIENDDVISELTQADIDEQKQQIENWIVKNNIVIGSGSDSDLVITKLREEIALAEEILRINPIVDSLFTDDQTNLAHGITQEDINNAQSEVSGLPDGLVKDRLQKEIDKAQDMLDAQDAVEDLFNDKKDNLADGIAQEDIDNAQDLVNKLPDGELKDELQKEIDKAQDMLDAQDAVEDLFNDKKDNLADGTTQKDIDNAQDLVNKLPAGELKDELQKEIDKAQDMLDAKEAVDNLFNDKKDNLADNVTQKDIDNTQELVNKLPDGELKDELQKEIDKAQAMQDAKDAANDLLDKDGNLNSNVTQEDIDNAQDLVNKLPDGELKDELQIIIDEAQKQLDEKNTSKPSTAPGTTVKPSVDSTSTTGGSNVNTGDETNMTLYMGLFAISLAGIVLVVRKRKIEE